MFRRTVFGLALIAGSLVVGPATPVRAESAAPPPDMTGQWRLDPKRSDLSGGPGGGERGVGRGGMRGESGGMGRGGMGGPGGGMGGGMGGPGGGMGGGRGGPGGGMGGPDGDAGGPGEMGNAEGGDRQDARPQGASRRPVRLPDLMHVTHTDQIVSFEDSTGTVLQEITTLGGAKDTLSHAPGAAVLAGTWRADTLVVERQGPRGKATETIRLEEKGTLLVIRMKLGGSGDMPAREIKRAYARVIE
jgi:hypothetical protein